MYLDDFLEERKDEDEAVLRVYKGLDPADRLALEDLSQRHEEPGQVKWINNRLQRSK